MSICFIGRTQTFMDLLRCIRFVGLIRCLTIFPFNERTVAINNLSSLKERASSLYLHRFWELSAFNWGILSKFAKTRQRH